MSSPAGQRTHLRGEDRIVTGKPLTAALIGCGAVSEILYAGALNNLANEKLIETVALVDPDPARTANIGQILLGTSQFQNLDAMLAVMTPNLAIIAAPHRFHAEIAVSCLERGIHVLCEKPMASSASECEQMIQTAAKSQTLLTVGHFRRFFPSCGLIKTLLESDLLGAVKSFLFLEGETYSWPAQSVSFFNRTEAGGGVLIDAGAHTLDLLMWWLGGVAELEYQDDAMGGVEANCRLFLKMRSGATGMVQLSRDWPLPNRYLINCERGWLAYTYDVVDRIEWGLNSSSYGLDSRIRLMAEGAPARRNLGATVPGFMDCFMAQLRNLISAIQGIEPLRVPGTEAWKCVTLIEKCYQNRQLLSMPWLDVAEIERARELAHV